MGQNASKNKLADAEPLHQVLSIESWLKASQIKPGFQLDPFPRELRLILEQRLVRDIVNLIADYSVYEESRVVSCDLIRRANYFRWLETTQFDLLLEGNLNEINLVFALFFLRLAASHIYLPHRLYHVYRELDQSGQGFNYQIVVSSVRQMLQLGSEIAKYLLIYQPVEPLEQFFLHVWRPPYAALTGLLEVVFTAAQGRYSINLTPLWQNDGNVFVQLVKVRGRLDASVFFNRVVSQYFSHLLAPSPYDPVEFLHYLTQLVEYSQW